MQYFECFDPRHEKTCFLHMQLLTKTQSNCAADQHLLFCYIDSRIPLRPKSEISSLLPSSVAVQTGLCQTWSETPKTGFLMMRLFLQRVCQIENVDKHFSIVRIWR